jgi:hypothetical protein
MIYVKHSQLGQKNVEGLRK